MWRVEAIGRLSGKEYLYEVEAPPTADPARVFNSACLQHGKLRREGEVDEFLDVRPGFYTVGYVAAEESV